MQIPTDDHGPAAQSRLLSLDVTRGLAVFGMILVNSAAYLYYVGKIDVYPVLLHASWKGFTLADFVFPLFIFIVGVAIPLGLGRAKDTRGLDRQAFSKITSRSLRLVAIGVILSNWHLANDFDWPAFRFFGVLQRIGLVYFAAAILYLTLDRKVVLVLAIAILTLYWPLTLLPVPDGTIPDLHIAGANFISWLDRALLGTHLYVKGPLGYDPEGILGTLPAIAQCLIGIVAGEAIRQYKHKPKDIPLAKMSLAGLAMIVSGLVWSLFFPLIKDIWSSSYVLLTSGLGLLLFAGLIRLIDIRGRKGWAVGSMAIFGANAMIGYVLHYLLSDPVLVGMLMPIQTIAGSVLSEKLSSLLPIALFLLVVWFPTYILHRKGWFVTV